MSAAVRPGTRLAGSVQRRPSVAAGTTAREALRLESAARRGRVAAALDRSLTIERAILALLLVEGLSVREASEATGIPSRRVETLYRRVMIQLGRAERGVPSTRRTLVSRPALRRVS